MSRGPVSERQEPTREELDRTHGPVLVEFGAEWCGHCQSFAPHLAELLGEHPGVRHIKVEDARAKPLGRSFRVKLWPTLVFLRDGQVVQQMARPTVDQARQALNLIAGAQDG